MLFKQFKIFHKTDFVFKSLKVDFMWKSGKWKTESNLKQKKKSRWLCNPLKRIIIWLNKSLNLFISFI